MEAHGTPSVKYVGERAWSGWVTPCPLTGADCRASPPADESTDQQDRHKAPSHRFIRPLSLQDGDMHIPGLACQHSSSRTYAHPYYRSIFLNLVIRVLLGDEAECSLDGIMVLQVHVVPKGRNLRSVVFSPAYIGWRAGNGRKDAFMQRGCLPCRSSHGH